MNFLKRAGAILMVVAIFASSCNKYADDFEQLNKKLDALATTVAGVPQLTTDMAAIKSQLTAIQTSIAALPTTASITALSTQLAATDAKVVTVSNNLNALAAVAATKTDLTASTAALTALINSVKTDLTKTITDQIAALTTLVNSNQAAVMAKLSAQDAAAAADLANLTNQINTLSAKLTSELAVTNGKIDASVAADLANYNALMASQTAIAADAAASAAAQDAQLATIVAGNTAMQASIAANQTSILQILTELAATPTPETVGTLVSAMQLQITSMEETLAIILANTAMYIGNVTLTSDAEVTFFLAKIAQIGIINGNLTINKAGISAGQLANCDAITSKITAVIGSGIVSVTFKAGDAVKLGALTSCSGAMTVFSTPANKGTGADVDLMGLSSVGGALTLDYDGPYESASLTKVGTTVGVDHLVLVNHAAVPATPTVGTTSINIPNVVVAGLVSDGGVPGTVVYPLATTVICGGNLENLSAAVATTVKLSSKTLALTGPAAINCPAATSIDLSAATSMTGAFPLVITAKSTGAVNLASLATATAASSLTVVSGTVDLTAWKANVALTLTGQTSISLPSLVSSPALSAAAAKTVTLAKYDWVTVPTLTVVENLTLGAINAPCAIPATVITANISGKVTTAVPMVTTAAVTTPAAAKLVTLTLGGTLATATVAGETKLTSLTTSGVVNTLIVNGNTIITGLNLGHKHYEGGLGSTLIVSNNVKLTSLTTSTDEMNTLVVTGNTLLASCNFASYVTPLLGGTTTITISNNNAMLADFVPAIAATFTTPYYETKIKSADLATLKAYVAATAAQLLPAPVTLVIAVDINQVNLNGASPATYATLIARVTADVAHTPAYAAPATGITTAAEFALVQ